MFHNLLLPIVMAMALQSALFASPIPQAPSHFTAQVETVVGNLANTATSIPSKKLDNLHEQILTTSETLPSEPHTSPWLVIMIGFLLVTGTLLYVDPKIF